MLSTWVKKHFFSTKAVVKHSNHPGFSFAVLVLILATAMPGLANAKGFFSEEASVEALAAVSVADLPKQGQQVYALIAQGGPFANDKDGAVFGNREQVLPKHRRGYYREYTVKTWGVRNRGAKRIVCGGLQVQTPEVCYYTEDHYSSFRKIVP